MGKTKAGAAQQAKHEQRRADRQRRQQVRGEAERAARKVAHSLGWGFAGTDPHSGAFVLTLPPIR